MWWYQSSKTAKIIWVILDGAMHMASLQTLKRHFLAQNRVIWCIKRKNRSNRLNCRRVQVPKKCSKFRTGGVYISPIWGAKTPGRIEPNFLVVCVHNVITPFKFGDDRFTGFGLAEGQSLPFPIDFEGRPYNTHTIVWGVIVCHVAMAISGAHSFRQFSLIFSMT